MKKSIRMLIVVLLVLTFFPFTAVSKANAADTAASSLTATDETGIPGDAIIIALIPEEGTDKTDGNLPSEGEETPSDTETEPDATPTDATPTDGEEPDGPAEFVISGTNIPVINGIYNYKLVILPPDKLVFDNDLENLYQGVKGRYQLHYEIDELDNHIMVVTGVFDNIMTESPLLIWYRDAITGDSYFYQLDLRTKEGFTYTNHLQYRIEDVQRGFSVHISYELATNQLTVEIEKPQDETEKPAFRPLKKLLEKIQSFFNRLFSCFKK